jgi:CRP/FNR family cyclic AMP-dependent transcriptional regulator
MRNVAASMLIRESPLFRGLPSATLERIEQLALRRTYRKNQIVFQQGGEADALYGVSTGQVLIGTSGADGKQVSLNIVGPGDVFGEIALLDRGPRTASATALVVSQLIVIQRDHFHALVAREPSIAFELLALMCRRLRWTTELIEESKRLSVREQLAKRLLTLGQVHGRAVPGGTELNISQGDLAQFLGVSRQVVNQHLQDWQREGWVELRRSRITICGPQAVRALSAVPVREQHK